MTSDSIKAWAKSRSATAHSFVVGIVVLAGLVVGNMTMRDYVLQLFAGHPKIGTTIITLAGIISLYSAALSPAGVVAEAKAVMQAPNPPTPQAVAAATVPGPKGSYVKS